MPQYRPMTTLKDELIGKIRAYCDANKIAPATFSSVVVDDGQFVHRLQNGGSCTLERYEIVQAALGKPWEELRLAARSRERSRKDRNVA